MTRTEYRMPGMCANFFSAPAVGGLFKGPARRACPIVVCGQGGCLSPLLRGWWPKVVVAPPVHVHVLPRRRLSGHFRLSMLRNLVGYPCDQTGSQPPLQLSHERLKGGNRKLFTGRPRGGTNYSGLSDTVTTARADHGGAFWPRA